MLGVLEEGMRLYPPVPTSLPRCTPTEGDVIAGSFVPGNVRILIRLMAFAQWLVLIAIF